MASTADRQHYTLQTIFSFFLGLMVVALIGVGVYTFYPSPGEAIQKQLQPLYDRQSLLMGKSGVETTETLAIQQQINDLNAKQTLEMEPWSRNTSIILVLFATLVMGISLIRSDQLRVLSNGLLLGGLFTMVYGSGWVIASGSSTARFLVVLFALAVTIGLGYLKFVRGAKQPAALAEGSVLAASADLGDLPVRVAALEDRLAAAASAFAPPADKDGR